MCIFKHKYKICDLFKNFLFFAINFNILTGLFNYIKYSAYFCNKGPFLIKRVTRFVCWFILCIFFLGSWKIIGIPIGDTMVQVEILT